MQKPTEGFPWCKIKEGFSLVQNQRGVYLGAKSTKGLSWCKIKEGFPWCKTKEGFSLVQNQRRVYLGAKSTKSILLDNSKVKMTRKANGCNLNSLPRQVRSVPKSKAENSTIQNTSIPHNESPAPLAVTMAMDACDPSATESTCTLTTDPVYV